jgi:hypothetical protein
MAVEAMANALVLLLVYHPSASLWRSGPMQAEGVAKQKKADSL